MNEADKATCLSQRAGTGLERLQLIMKVLRGPNGCPWDREQTLQSLKPCLLEETYELLEAMDEATPTAHREELGDVLLQVVFQSEVCAEADAFTLDDVAHNLCNKLVRRHPHIFGDTAVSDADEVLRNWEAIKKTERAASVSALAGIPKALPALLRAQRTQAKASRLGFDWPTIEGPLAKISEEIAELQEAMATSDQRTMAEEMGDLLFSFVNFCRFCQIDAEQALQGATARFHHRFQEIERVVNESGRDLKELTLGELDELWEQAKHQT